MENYINELNKIYKSAKFEIDENGILVVYCKKIYNDSAKMTYKQSEYVCSFCKYRSAGLFNLTKAAASAVIGFHKKYPNVKIYIDKR